MSNDPSTSEILNALSVHDTTAAGIARRRFLQGALAFGGAAALGPTLGTSFAGAAGPPLGPDERILILILMGGGNDGFKMVSPLDDATFVGTRSYLADDPSVSHAIGSGLYLNQYLPDIKSMWDDGDVACVVGVGNPLDDRSHFSSMASWMAGEVSSPPYNSGWVGRHVDNIGHSQLGAVSIGDSGVPLHMVGLNGKAVGISNYGSVFGAGDADWELRRYRNMLRYAEGDSGISPWVDLAGDTFAQAINVAGEISPAYEALDDEDGIVRSLTVAAGLVNLDLGVRVIGTSYGDFDHHDDQAYPYQQRMTELNEAITRFYATLDPVYADRVTIATFSEFGRSFTPNGSNGTDHGTASNFLVIGRNVKGGLYGEMPSLTSLDSWGDMQHTVDFRSYYATLIGGWLGGDSNEVLGGAYEELDLFESNPTSGSGTAVLAASCLSDDGRFDIDIVNVGTAATFVLDVSGLPSRTRDLGAGESATMTVTGRPDREYTVRVTRDGQEIMNESVTVQCDPALPEVRVDQSCLAANGRFDVHLHNPSDASAMYSVKLSGLPIRNKSLAAGASGRITFTGRPDGNYQVWVARDGQQIHHETATVGCDPVSDPITVETSCLSSMGRVDVHLRNTTKAERSYAVIIGGLAPRNRIVQAGGYVRVSATGRADGPIRVVVRGDGDVLHVSNHTIACAV